MLVPVALSVQMAVLRRRDICVSKIYFFSQFIFYYNIFYEQRPLRESPTWDFINLLAFFFF